MRDVTHHRVVAVAGGQLTSRVQTGRSCFPMEEVEQVGEAAGIVDGLVGVLDVAEPVLREFRSGQLSGRAAGES